jgi:hypothetical protein
MEGGQQASSYSDSVAMAKEIDPAQKRRLSRQLSAGDLNLQRKRQGFRNLTPAKSMKKGR